LFVITDLSVNISFYAKAIRFMKIKNISGDIPFSVPEEIVDELISSENIRIHRIVSKGQVSPPDFWYDQDDSEWVMVIKGKATLKFMDEDDPVELNEGDYLNIPPHKKHRVEWTDPETETIWVAVFY
jgi:cupin 2 domain-containing protein